MDADDPLIGSTNYGLIKHIDREERKVFKDLWGIIRFKKENNNKKIRRNRRRKYNLSKRKSV